MTENPHPLTVFRAAELWDDTPTIGGEWLWHQMDGTMRRRIIAAMRAAYDAGRDHEREHADPHHDPRPWQDCTVEDIREGDLVERRRGDTLIVGVAHHQDEDGDWFTENGYLLTVGGCWPLRRIPAPTPPALDPLADLTPATILRDVTVEGHGVVGDAFILGAADGRYVATAHFSHLLSSLTAFTTDDRTTRYTREGDTWTAETLDGDA